MKKSVICLILLFSFFWELTDPTTNFIRCGIVAKVTETKLKNSLKEICQKTEQNSNAQNIETDSCSQDQQASNTNNQSNKDDVITCYAILIAEVKPISIHLFPTKFNTVSRQFIDNYNPEIFQPPKV